MDTPTRRQEAFREFGHTALGPRNRCHRSLNTFAPLELHLCELMALAAIAPAEETKAGTIDF
jgi:hypothetical protein